MKSWKTMPTIKTLRPVHPNAGIEAAYRKRLKRLIAEMQDSIVYWVEAKYRANIAHDSLPAAELQDTLDDLAFRWKTKFDLAADDVAAEFAQKNLQSVDGSFDTLLKQSGLEVKFAMTPAMRDAYQAVININVGLIKSIADEHLQEVQGLVMRAIQQGGGMGELSGELAKRYGITKRRASFIARDQTAKATQIITKVRQEGLGITEAVWVHSSGGKHPRPSHVKAGRDKLVYKISEGALIDDKRIWPGSEINCRCVSSAVIPGLAP